MAELALLLVAIYWIGFFVAGLFVYRVRAGLGVWEPLGVFGPGGVGIGWTALFVVKVWFWPVVLIVWLATGRPEPRILFNDKADAARQRDTEDRESKAREACGAPAVADFPRPVRGQGPVSTDAVTTPLPRHLISGAPRMPRVPRQMGRPGPAIPVARQGRAPGGYVACR